MKIIESPREGLQGFSGIIDTDQKVRYINHLLKVGFDTVEIGSFVSPGVIPQMADSMDVLKQLDFSGTTSNVMFLVVHSRGAEKLAGAEGITHISYPFSFSPTFLKLNVKSTVNQSLDTTKLVTDLCQKHSKQAVIYISMAFGNPYGDPWSLGMLVDWIAKLHDAGVRTVALSNVSMEIDATEITTVYSALIPAYPDVEFGLHLHTSNHGWYKRVDAAYMAGCRRFDGVINGWGGCPMAGKEMLGNLKTENLIEYADKNDIRLHIDREKLLKGYQEAALVFRE
jgi:hydroxymethylglutaryl-CoA lyase